MKLKAFFLSLFLLVPMFAFCGVTGRYKVSGINPDGSTYKGKMFITKKDRIYSAKWFIFGGGQQTGTGVWKDHKLSFVFQDKDDPTFFGVVLYKVDDDTLKGPWAVFGGTSRGFEKIKKIKRHR